MKYYGKKKYDYVSEYVSEYVMFDSELFMNAVKQHSTRPPHRRPPTPP